MDNHGLGPWSLGFVQLRPSPFVVDLCLPHSDTRWYWLHGTMDLPDTGKVTLIYVISAHLCRFGQMG